MTRMASRLERLARSRPVPTPRTYDLSRLSDEQLDRLLVLRERIDLVGLEELTPGELEDLAELADVLEGGPVCHAQR
jgi:hypothetical protein